MMSKYRIDSPLKFLLVVMIAVASAEYVIMHLLNRYLDFLSPGAISLVDSILLFGLMFFSLYFMIFRPLQRNMGTLDRERERLRKSEEFKDGVFNNIWDSISVIDPNDFRILTVNDTFLKVIGMKREEVIGRTCYEVTHRRSSPCEAPEDPCPLKETMATGERSTFFHTHYAKEGRSVFVEVTTTPLTNERGVIDGVIHITRDMTEKKRAEVIQDALYRISEATSSASSLDELFHIIHLQLGRLTDTRNFYIALYDRENDLYSFPYIRDDVEEEDEFTPQQLRKSFTDYVRRTGNPLLVNDIEHCELVRNGEVDIVGEPSAQWLGVPLRSGGEVLGVVAVQSYSDPNLYTEKDLDLMAFVSEHIATAIDRKRSEQELKLAQFSIDHSSQALFWIGSDARIHQVNNHACRVLGYSRDELLTMTLHDIEPGLPAENWPERWEELKEKGSLKTESMYRTRDGLEYPVEISANHFEYEGRGYCFAYAIDISERKKLDRLRDEFISTVSHELRTPLTSIHGSIDLIKQGLAGELPERAKAMIDIACRNSTRLKNLVNDFLDIQKIESGKITIDMEPLKIVPIVELSVENNRSFGDQFNVEYRLDDFLPDLEVRGDGDRLAQVLDNLLSNAAKFSPAEGEVEISISRCNEKIRVAVRDHGEGIPEDFRDKIFEKFSQADTSSSRQSGGTGLGLSIAKLIVERHGGTIGFDTETGVGTTFYFDLPEWKPETGTPDES